MEQGHRIIRVELTVTALTERNAELKRDNRRLRGTVSVEGQRVDRLKRDMSRMQRELRQIRHITLLCLRKMHNTRSGASMTQEEIEGLVTHRVAEEMEAREAVINLEPLNESGDEQENRNKGNGGNRNGGNGEDENEGNRENGNGGNVNGGRNGNRNRNKNHDMNYRGFMPVARECTFQDFLKCMPHNFSGTALTWWNFHKRTIGVDAAYAIKWAELMKLMTKVYCPRNKIQKMETELMVPDEKDKVERFIGGLPDNIQRNMIAANLARLQDAIRIANQLMDKNLQGYAAKSVENERRGYAGTHPLYNKCIYHNVGPCTVKCNNCKRVGHQIRDCRSTDAVLNMQRAPFRNQQGVISYESGRPGYVKRDCPKLRNQSHRNRVEKKDGNKAGNNKATTRAYAISGGGANPDSNFITSTFLLNNCYDFMLFNSGADRSFVSSTFSVLVDIAPSTLNTSYAVELADGRISKMNVILRRCT
ncbi:putative reverse transcriptase domain-containing protein [Tanacetum coccineum]